jgi:type IV secretory pathway VirB6-like protein
VNVIAAVFVAVPVPVLFFKIGRSWNEEYSLISLFAGLLAALIVFLVVVALPWWLAVTLVLAEMFGVYLFAKIPAF